MYGSTPSRRSHAIEWRASGWILSASDISARTYSRGEICGARKGGGGGGGCGLKRFPMVNIMHICFWGTHEKREIASGIYE